MGIIIFVILFLLSSCIMGFYRFRAIRQLRKYEKIVEEYTNLFGKRENSKASEYDSIQQVLNRYDTGLLEQEDAEVLAEGESMATVENVEYDWNSLRALNKDIAGWLNIPGTVINFPVVYAQDNDFYLTHDFAGEKDSAGCAFMPVGSDSADHNRVIYAHNMSNGSEAMFSTLLLFENPEWREANPIIFFSDAGGRTQRYEILAVIKDYSMQDLGKWDFRKRKFHTFPEYYEWEEEAVSRALYATEPCYDGINGLITLVTCDRRNIGKDGRFIVIGISRVK